MQELTHQNLNNVFGTGSKEIAQLIPGEIISIDGKTLKHSGSKGIGKKAIHVVNAWANEQRLVLGQTKVNDKSNEITAIPELIKVLELTGCLVTIDAMGLCRKNLRNVAKNLILEKRFRQLIRRAD